MTVTTVSEEIVRCFARLAFRFAFLAFLRPSPHAPFRRAHPEMTAKSPGERRGGAEAAVEGDVGDAAIIGAEQRVRRLLQPEPPHVLVERLACHGGEQAMEVEGAEERRARHGAHREVGVEIVPYVIESEIEPSFVLPDE